MDPNEKAVYLTFDDGPIPEATPWILDTLDEYRQNKQRITERLSALRTELAEVAPSPDTSAFMGRVETSLTTLTDTCASEIIKNQVLRTFVEQIIFMKPSGRIEIVYHL